MADTPSPLDRIDTAIARIEASIYARDTASSDLARRHETLRHKIAQAIGAIDDMITPIGER